MDAPAHPYRGRPDTSFWSRSVAGGWNAADLFAGAAPVLRADDRIVSAGSCFAGNIVPYLEAAGFHYVRSESLEPAEGFHYHVYSAGYGNIYTPRQLLQLVRRCTGDFTPVEDRWRSGEAVIDPFRPGLPYPCESDAEFDLLTRSHLDLTREAFTQATAFVFTLGLTEAWLSRADGAVFPVCPGTVAGSFDPDRHAFVNFRVAEIVADLAAAIDALRALNPALRVILTVSPVPLVATATENHVFVANTYSKSVLRAACAEICADKDDVCYFPAFEIVMADAAGNFLPDRRNVTEAGVHSVVAALFQHCQMPAGANAAAPAPKAVSARELSASLVRRECEEAMNDPDRARRG